MRRPILSAKRMLAQAPLLAAVFGVAVVVTALLAGIPRYLDLAAVDSARGTLASSPVRSSTVQLLIRLADEASAQDAAVQQVFAEQFPAGSVAIARSVRTDPVTASVPVNGGEPVETSVVLAADDAAEQRVELTAGVWPRGDGLLEFAAAGDSAAARGSTRC